MTRLEKTMEALREKGKKGLFIYLMAGAPDTATTLAAVREAVERGADVIELGIPFSDPMADGPVIQKAGMQSIKGGMTVQGVLALVRKIRAFSDIPIVYMGYINNILNFGMERFVSAAKHAGADGLILPDVPYEEGEELRHICHEHDFHLIGFVTPGSAAERIKTICAAANGFIYCVSVNGVTGVRKIDYTPISRIADSARQICSTPLAVGFGIGTPETAVEAAEHADAVIVGSAVVKRILANDVKGAGEFIYSLRKALDERFCVE